MRRRSPVLRGARRTRLPFPLCFDQSQAAGNVDASVAEGTSCWRITARAIAEETGTKAPPVPPLLVAARAGRCETGKQSAH